MGQNNTPKAIPDKTYFKIGEVCDITGVKSHTLRYWESEFAVIKPKRAGSKQRLYRRVDVENIIKIKSLMQEDGLTIAGTRKYLAKQNQKPCLVKDKTRQDILAKIKQELIAIKGIMQ